MKKINTVLALGLLILVSSCATQKKKDDVSFLKQFYHNTTAEFNGYFNADVIMQESVLALNSQEQENYNKILPVYKYVAAKDPKPVAPELDRAIEKVSVVVSLHRISDWTDDCYTLMGQAQYLKKDYESAEETFEYTVAEFNPETLARQKAKYAKQYSKKARKGSKSVDNKEKKQEQKEKEKERDEVKKEKEQTAKQKKKAREKERKAKNKEIKKKRKAKKKGKKYKKSTPSKPKTTTPTPDTPKKEETPKPEKEDDNKKKEKPKATEDKEKALKREPAYQEARLWLARTYIEREKYDRAENIFTELSNSGNTYKAVRAEIGPAMAHFHLKQKEYDKAIPWLEQSIDITKDRQNKARYAYILGQLYKRQNNASQALAYFDKAKKFSNDYEMEFNAELSMAQNEYLSGKSSPEATIKKLERALKDAKNIEYKDQIYFALANVAIENKQSTAAIDYLLKSIELNTGNIAQKGESFVALADLYYQQDAYVEAKRYYDQALSVIGESDERYDKIERLSKNLIEIAENIEIITLKDSLLMISGLDEKELKKLAQKINEGKQKAIAEAKDSAAAKSKGPAIPTSQSITLGNSTGGLRNAPSTFPFYNEKSLRKGEKDFNRIWDDRQLSDDWRRSNRPGFTEDDITEDEKEDITKELSKSEIEQMFKDVPKTEEEKTATRALIQDAMIALGRLYRERIQRDDKAINILEDRLLVEYPKTKHELDAWYYLYLSHTNSNNTAKAQEYKDKITKKYPTTTFSKILTDPNYAAEVMKSDQNVSDYYDATYQEFEKGNYKKAYDRSSKVGDLFGNENPLKARFALLTAICTGNISGKESYIIALKDVIAKYPDTSEQTRAKEILRLLEGRGASAVSTSAAVEEAASKKFIPEEDKLHYMLIVITDKGDVKINDAKSSIAAFNRVNNKLDKLRISNIYLGTDTNRPIMVVRKFASKEKAMLYYNAAISSDADFIPKGMSFEVYPITQNNYRQILKDKSLDGYSTFFEENYLN